MQTMKGINGWNNQQPNNKNQLMIRTIMDYQNAIARQDSLNEGMKGVNGWNGWGGALAKGVMGYMSGKAGKKANELESEISQLRQNEADSNQLQKASAQQAEIAEKIKALVPQFGVNSAKAIVLGGVSPSDLQKKDNSTPTMRNLASMGLEQGTPEYNQAMQQQMKSKGGTTVNVGDRQSQFEVGTIPQGYYKAINPETNRPELYKMQGGEPQETQANDNKQMKMAIDNDFANFGNLDQTIEDTIKQVGYGSSGFLGGMMQNVGGSSAADLKANLNTIGADAAFSTLVNLKKAGGTLGAISQTELDLLKSAKAALNVEQSPEQLRQNLSKYQNVRRNAMNRVAEAYKQDFGQYPQGFDNSQESQQPTQQIQTIVNPQTGERMALKNGQWVKL